MQRALDRLQPFVENLVAGDGSRLLSAGHPLAVFRPEGVHQGDPGVDLALSRSRADSIRPAAAMGLQTRLSAARNLLVTFMAPVPRAEFVDELSVKELPDVDDGRACLLAHPIPAALFSEPSLPLLPLGDLST